MGFGPFPRPNLVLWTNGIASSGEIVAWRTSLSGRPARPPAGVYAFLSAGGACNRLRLGGRSTEVGVRCKVVQDKPANSLPGHLDEA